MKKKNRGTKYYIGMKNVKEMTIADVLKTPEWQNNVSKIIEQIEKMRLKAANAARKADKKLKANPTDRIIEKDLLNVDKITELYTEILEKRCKLSSIERTVIFAIGMDAYNKTMKELTKDNPELLKDETAKD